MKRVVAACVGVVVALVFVLVMIVGWSVGRGVGVASVPAEASTATPSAAPSGTPAAGSAMTSSDQMDTLMAASMKPFPAKTAGVGGQPLAPTILADGTKQFDLTAAVVQWEISPGKKVEAWSYNGTVPGPSIHVNVGDRVAVVLHNRLPESTTVHFHGIQMPFVDDGTPYVSQAPIKPGQDFTYSFTASAVATGFYHSHHDAVKQMPNGLYGAITVGELSVPAGITVTGGNQPLFLNDSGTIGLSLNGKSFPATAPLTAKVGEWIEVTYYNAGQMSHPMHLHEFSQLVIAQDGHPVPAPYQVDTVEVAPGARYTVLVNANLPGVWVWHCHILSHAENSTGMVGMVTALVVQ